MSISRGPALARVNDLALLVRAEYARIVEPRPSGLPNLFVALWFPALVALGAIALTVLQLGGTSSGMHWFNLGTGEDPRLLLGTPRAIRSDEWLVQQSWVVAQSNSGYPDANGLFAGGTDMTVLSELPSWHWSSIFRPHLWGYLLFGLDTGAAWFWWVTAFLLVASAYAFVVSLLPRRPLTGAAMAIAVYFTPMLQWLYTPSTVLPVAWTLLAMAGVVWVLRSARLRVRIIVSAVVGYLAVTMVLGLYVPFMLPNLIVFLGFSLAYALRERAFGRISAPTIIQRSVPMIIAGVAAAAVVVAFVATRWSTFEAIQATVYPGQRSVPPGQLLSHDPLLLQLGGAPWSQALKSGVPSVLGPNSSEAATVLLLAVFLVPAIVWFIIVSLRRNRTVDWLLVALLATMLLFCVYLFVPGWQPVASALQLDRIPAERMKHVLIVLGVVSAVAVIERADTISRRTAWLVGGLGAVATASILALQWTAIRHSDPAVLAAASLWPEVCVAVVLAVLFLSVRRLVPLAAALLLVISVVLGYGVNPLYRGVFDLSATATGAMVSQIDSRDPGTWVGVGSYETMAILTEVDISSFSGVQNYPTREMWDQIDPEGRFEPVWNRLGHVHWLVGSGSLRIANPSPDVIEVTFDPCSEFAENSIDYVLSDGPELTSQCLMPITTVKQGAETMRFYEIVESQ